MNLIGPRSYLPRELPDMGQHAKIILDGQTRANGLVAGHGPQRNNISGAAAAR